MLKMKYKLLPALVIAAPLLVNTGIATTVHACTNNNSTGISNIGWRNTGAYNKGDGSTFSNSNSNIIYRSYFSFENFKTKLDALVTAGTISQDQEIIILNLYNKGDITSENFKVELDVLVTTGSITQSQEVSILNLFSILQPSLPAPVMVDNSGHNGSGINNLGYGGSTSNSSGHKCSK
ncbi:hypothetical protein ACJDU8_20070 [Clostridium sp. WILCCON 0269]|uniref:Uncharacterized protein n=1 Tax=Candidatus Clostridium eludens TaxID=3381663 RepID=A0ABW8SP43_9CLOT